MVTIWKAVVAFLTAATTIVCLDRDAWAAEIVYPEAADGPLDNPMKGWCPYVDAGTIQFPYSMVFFPVAWNELEPREGQYAFDKWEEKAWNDEKARGKHVAFRIYADMPARPTGMPQWLLDKGVRLTAYTDHMLKMVEMAHFSWVGPYCPALEPSPTQPFMERANQLVRRMGYQFALTEVRHDREARAGGELKLSLKGENQGVAPFYYPWTIEFALLDRGGKPVARMPTKWNIRKWLPGEFAESAVLSCRRAFRPANIAWPWA